MCTQSLPPDPAMEYGGIVTKTGGRFCELNVTEVVRILQQADVPFFKKTMKRRSICELEIPALFVRKHGDKILQKATLQSAPNGKAWPVKLIILGSSPARVRISGGLTRFLIATKIQEQDQLILSLVAMSKFVVYIFDQHGTPHISRTARSGARKAGGGALRCQSKSSWTRHLGRRTLVPPCSPARTGIKDNILEETDSLEGDHVKTESIHKLSVDLLKDREVTKTTEARRMAKRMQRFLHERGWPARGDPSFGNLGFQKKLSELHTACYGRPCNASMEIPAAFVRRHGKHIQNSVVSLEGPSGLVCHIDVVNSRTASTYSNHGRIHLRSGWSEFVELNKLRKGDQLLFTLTAPSHFLVEVSERCGTSMSSMEKLVAVSPGLDPPASGKNERYVEMLERLKRQASESVIAEKFQKYRSCHCGSQYSTTLPTSGSPRKTTYPFLAIPVSFLRHHGGTLPRIVHLRGPLDSVPWQVSISRSTVHARRWLTTGWKEFATANKLDTGDQLLFSFFPPSLFVIEHMETESYSSQT